MLTSTTTGVNVVVLIQRVMWYPCAVKSRGQPERRQRPIEYWLKELDRLIDKSLDNVLSEYSLSRRHWQVLNAIGAGTSRQAINDDLLPFATTDPQGTELAIDLLLERGLGVVDEADGSLFLSPQGATLLQDLRALIDAERQSMAVGITAEQYNTTIMVLERMVGNLSA